MSSSPPPEQTDPAPITEPIPLVVSPAGSPPSRSRRPHTLRTTLIVGIVALITAVCAVIGVTTELFLRDYLVGQVDNQLIQVHNAAKAPDRQRGDELTCASPGGRFAPGQGFNSMSVVVDDGVVASSGILMPAGSSAPTCTPVPASSDAALTSMPTDGRVRTIMIEGVGDYRVVASTLPDGRVLINGSPLAAAIASLVQLGIIMGVVTGIALLVGGFAVFWIVRRSLRPLDRVVATARQVSTLPLDRGEVDLAVRVPERDTDTRTEVGQVGAALNQMLGHVSGALVARQASEMRVRQFVADASHELRTPLAAIRGYAELARREEDDTEGIAHALRRVESESARMTTLVDDLLLLARLDSGRPLSADEVDLTLVVVDAVSDARVAGPTHRWQLDLPEEPVTTIGDSARLHQVLANLLANARTHTPAGTTVWSGLRTEPGVSVITVTDNGPGIPDALQPEIFNRFVRGDSSRSRAAGSTGLGLAIVDAVVSAHGGSVSVYSRPGQTTFTVRLPHEVVRAGAGRGAPSPVAPSVAPSVDSSAVHSSAVDSSLVTAHRPGSKPAGD
ncbi:MAG TPA: HAMP domain-containing sensor histidine kinase [Nakamurella sp.]